MQVKDLKKILIIGAGRGLGLGLTKAALKFSNANIIASYRSKSRSEELIAIDSNRLEKLQIDPFDTEALIEFSKNHKDIDLIINAVGFLHNDEIKPEKSLRDIDIDNLMYSFKVNATLTPHLMQHLKNSISKESCYMVLGAMVGSISDNELGGWYGYRASKAALNMFVKNIDIELKRTNKNVRMLVFHPGTTKTDLSAPYLSGVQHKLWERDEAGENLFQLIEKVYPEEYNFYFWDGSVLPY